VLIGSGCFGAGFGEGELLVAEVGDDLQAAACGLVTWHGERGLTARLLPFTIDGLIWAASMVVLDASRRHHPVPSLAKWSLAVGIVAAIGANLVHGLNQRGRVNYDVSGHAGSTAGMAGSKSAGGLGYKRVWE
jgi:Protein of unknown function (DUF2637)